MDHPRWATRPETGTDHVAIRRVVVAAFPTVAEADLVDALRNDPEAWIEGLSIVAVDANSTMIGHALLTRCFIGETPALCLAPVSVLPDFQGRGVGTAVINTVLAAARSMNEPFAIVLGDPAYYARFGFQTGSCFGIRLPMDVPDEASMAMSLMDGLALPRGLVRFPAPFGLP